MEFKKEEVKWKKMKNEKRGKFKKLNGKALIFVVLVLFATLAFVSVGIGCASATSAFSSQLLVSEGYTPDVAVDGSGVIYVVWEELLPEGWPTGDYIFISKSPDGGGSFAPKVPICKGEGLVFYPSIAIDGSGNVHVVWLNDEYHIYYANSIDGGSTFSNRVKVSDAVASCLTHPDIAVDSNGVIYVVWGGDDDYIYIDKSTDGTTFATDVIVDTDTSPMRSAPSIAIDRDDNIHVVGHRSHVYYVKSTDGGATFSPRVQVDDSDYEAYNPSIGIGADGKIFVAWEDLRGLTYYGYIYAAVSSDGGTSFGAGVKVDDDATAAEKRTPSLAVHPCGTIFVAWRDGRNESNPDIYFANSNNSGSSFGTNIKVNSVNGKEYSGHRRPVVAVNYTNAFVVWQGQNWNASTWMIYFAKADIEPCPTPAVPLVVNQTSPACTSGSAYYSTIKTAIAAANNGDTILVCPSIYNENVDVTKNLTIKSYSQNPSDTIVQAVNANDHVFYVTANSVNISGFTVKGASNYTGSWPWPAGIYINAVNYVNISNNDISNNFVGILSSQGYSFTGTVIENNNITSNNNKGIFLHRATSTTIATNRISSNGDLGIALWYFTHSTIASNTVNSDEISISDDADSNTIMDNVLTSSYIWLHDASYNTLTNNSITNGRVLLRDSSNNNSIINNTINTGDGIWLETINNRAPNYNTIAGNTIASCNNGIKTSLYSSGYTNKPSNNFIYHNNLIDNINQATDIGINTWDNGYPSGGNYWSDHACHGNPSNGSEPYEIDADSIDHYPFEYMSGWEITPSKPKVSISTDKYEYTTGDTMLIELTLTNPTAEWQNVNFLWRLDLPDYGLYFPIMNNKLLGLPPGFNETFTLPWGLPSWGFSFNAAWYVALYDAKTSELICDDTADWRYVGGAVTQEEIIPEEIAEEIARTIEKAELLT